MPTWNSEQYLRFAAERTQPARDLAARVTLSAPQQIVDLGCGPGNSTAVVAERWPDAAITGVDSSPSMLATARREHPRWGWQEADIAQWCVATAARPAAERPNLVFSNAALQWVPRHAEVVDPLFDAVAPAGALAFQIPYTGEVSHQRRMRELAASPAWRGRFTSPPAAWAVEPLEFYYDALAPRATRVDLWITDYIHVLSGPEAIVEWYRGTGLRPYLEALPDDSARSAFLADYLAAITPDHPRRADGHVLMPFRRLFVIAYR